MNDTYFTISIKPGKSKRFRQGHPWVFSNEVTHPSPKPKAGALAVLNDEKGRFAAYVTYNPHSLISARVLSRDRNDVPGSIEWFSSRIQDALALRQRLYPNRMAYRLVYGDADNLPGLVIDRYGDCLAVQILTAGMELLVEPLVEALLRTLGPKAVVLRNSADMRTYENLELYDKVAYGEPPEELVIEENGVKLAIDILHGQKTGHFFDQTENRLALLPYVKDADMLDLFCHVGAWGVGAAVAGAKRVTAVDVSQKAVEAVLVNAQLNGVSGKIEAVTADAFTWLSEMRKNGRGFDLVVVDPPAFAKSAKLIHSAMRGYEDINRQAIHQVRENGIFCSCSCSYHVNENEFIAALQRAAARERRHLRILEVRGQAKDHPVLLSLPESRYLKCVVGIVNSW